MCRTPVNKVKNNNICVYCGSTNHTSGNCTSQLNDNRKNSGLHQGIFTVLDHTMEQIPKTWQYPEEKMKYYKFQASTHQKLGNYASAGQ